MIYEILPVDFNGGIDTLDDQVLWVEAGSIEHAKLYAAKNGMDPHRVGDLSQEVNEKQNIDLYIDENGEVTDTESGTTTWISTSDNGTPSGK
jgi:hypothetical protein